MSRDTLLRARVVLPVVLPGVSRDTLLRVRRGVARHALERCAGVSHDTLLRARAAPPVVWPGVSRDTLLRLRGGVARHASESGCGAAGGVTRGVARPARESAPDVVRTHCHLLVHLGACWM